MKVNRAASDVDNVKGEQLRELVNKFVLGVEVSDVERMHIRIPNCTEEAEDLIRFCRENGYDYTYIMARAAVVKFQNETGVKYTIPVAKVKYEIQLHLPLYELGIFRHRTDYTDVSTDKGGYLQNWIDNTYDLFF